MRLRFFPAAVRYATVLLVALSLTAGLAGPRASVASAAGPAQAAVEVPIVAAGEEVQPVTTTAVPKPQDLVVRGRGFGHGRGLGQWGAYGYAEKGWDYRQILAHYYGGSAIGYVAPTSAIGVRLTALDSKVLTVFQPRGRTFTAVEGQPGFTFPPSFGGPVTPPPNEIDAAASLTPNTSLTVNAAPSPPPILSGAPGAIRVQYTKGGWLISDGPSCTGPWTPRPPVSSRSITISAGPIDPAIGADDPSQMLQICEGAKTRRVYRGDLLTTVEGASQRTVNLVALDAYLRSVVPREVSAGWADRAYASVQAQAVAARSYAAAEKRTGFSNTCDTISCQVYSGRGRYDGETFVSLEDPRTDRAIAETANEIRVHPRTGVPLRTEFSASTGGHTAPGDFPPVPDEGDATQPNPNKSWTVRIPAAKFADKKLGVFRTAKVVTRDGVGADGGRATLVRFVYTNGSFDMRAGEFMKKFALKSTWFSFDEPIPPPTVATASPTTTIDPNAPVVAVAAVDTAPAVEVATTSTTKPGSKAEGKHAKSPKTAAKTKKPGKSPVVKKPVVVAVAAGADPVRTVGETPLVEGVPTTVPPKAKAPATKNAKKKRRA